MCRHAYKGHSSEYPLLRHAQALKETVPLFCLFLCIGVCTISLVMTIVGRSILQEMFPPLFQAVVGVLGVLVAMVGLTSTVSASLPIFLHLERRSIAGYATLVE